MAQFKFTLNTVLQHRQRIEDQCQRDLARLLRQQLILQTQVQSLQQTIVDDKHDLADALTGPVNVDRVRRHGAHVNHVTVRVQQIIGQLVVLKRKIDQARQELAQAVQDRKALKVLHDREFSRWSQQIKRRETAELDELGLQSYVRQQRERVA